MQDRFQLLEYRCSSKILQFAAHPGIAYGLVEHGYGSEHKLVQTLSHHGLIQGQTKPLSVVGLEQVERLIDEAAVLFAAGDGSEDRCGWTSALTESKRPGRWP